jgi:glycine/D-amino acid oxidase-like deaminating enzyme
MVGANIALELVSQGAQVTILSTDDGLGSGATPNSFAWITNQTFFRAKDPVPEEQARDYFNLHRLGHAAWRRLQLKLPDDLGVRWNGVLQWAGSKDAEDLERLKCELERRQKWGSPTYRVNAEQIHRLVPALKIDEDPEFAFFTSDEGAVNPFTALPAILKAAVRLGAELKTSREVGGFRVAPDGKIIVQDNEKETICDKVIIAAGCHTPELATQVGIKVPLAESRGHLVHFAPQPGFLDPVVMAPNLHAQQRSDGRVIVARHFTGVSSGNINDDDTLDINDVIEDARRAFPKLREAEVEKTTSGRRIVPVDGLPIIGESSEIPGVHAIATNAGISLGPIFGQLIAMELMHGIKVDVLNGYRAERFS